MILDRLSNASLYRGVHPLFARAFEALTNEDWLGRKDGRYELDGQRLYAMVQRYSTRPREQGKWEAHRRYIDIQYLAQGAEKMGWGECGAMRIVQPYDEARDAMFLDGEEQCVGFVNLAAGSFAVFHPQDAHMPGLAVGATQPVVKVVLKVAVE